MPTRAPHPRKGWALLMLHLDERQCEYQIHSCRETFLSWNGSVNANVHPTKASVIWTLNSSLKQGVLFCSWPWALTSLWWRDNKKICISPLGDQNSLTEPPDQKHKHLSTFRSSVFWHLQDWYQVPVSELPGWVRGATGIKGMRPVWTWQKARSPHHWAPSAQLQQVSSQSSQTPRIHVVIVYFWGQDSLTNLYGVCLGWELTWARVLLRKIFHNLVSKSRLPDNLLISPVE